MAYMGSSVVELLLKPVQVNQKSEDLTGHPITSTTYKKVKKSNQKKTMKIVTYVRT